MATPDVKQTNAVLIGRKLFVFMSSKMLIAKAGSQGLKLPFTIATFDP